MEKSTRSFSSFKRFTPQNNYEAANEKEKNVVSKDPNPGNKGASSSTTTQQSKAPAQRQNNPYAKPSLDKCYRCQGQGHKSNVCPSRRTVALLGEEEDEEQEFNEDDEYEGVEFAEEESHEKINIVLQRILLSSKDEGQRKNLFRTHCSIQNKVCNVIVDNGSTENLVSQKLVDFLKLPTKEHENPILLGG
ncbi:unnamed protein product [Microthlaspi erraticum]|uniref:CCHC-type domain-containing protein n=1 Tax=Microthlaspi erraticum TaxID=1685480 RepID=A0A6D2LBB7_9BRAS|nr:unnamed protein product [Microthlaspi erraticum]